MDDFNFSGGAIQGGHVLGKIMLDIIGTQGLTSSRVMASAKYMASANNFKSVDAYRKYVKLANKGYQKALGEDKNFLAGLNVHKGHVTYKAVADVFGHSYVAPEEAIKI